MHCSKAPPVSASFLALGIAPKILDILAQRNFTEPTPIQQQSIPAGILGKDIVGIAQTGTGKTFAFGIPMLQRLAQGSGRGLVILPTRELAEQVDASLQIFATTLGIRTAVLIGGVPIARQTAMIRRNPRVVIATPGRLNDHLEQGTITLREVSILVLDEADRMLDMGFWPQIQRILHHVPKERQTLLFSATMPHEVLELARHHMRLPLRIEVAPAGTTVEKIAQELFIVEKQDKLALLTSLLEHCHGSALVFIRTKYGAKKIAKSLNQLGFRAAELHANRSLSQRREALEGFKTGKYRVLVATDIAARGIDVAGIALVVNFDLPSNPADYVHRIGRTARAGREGRAVSFASADQHREIREIERLIRISIKRSPVPEHVRRTRRTPALTDRSPPIPDGTHPQGTHHHPHRSGRGRLQRLKRRRARRRGG